MSVRRIHSLIAGLTPGCALHRSTDPQGYGSQWTTNEELLATIAELIDQLNRMFLQAHSDTRPQLGDPLRIPRPWEERESEPEQRRQATPAEIKAFFGKHIIPSGRDN